MKYPVLRESILIKKILLESNAKIIFVGSISNISGEISWKRTAFSTNQFYMLKCFMPIGKNVIGGIR